MGVFLFLYWHKNNIENVKHDIYYNKFLKTVINKNQHSAYCKEFHIFKDGALYNAT